MVSKALAAIPHSAESLDVPNVAHRFQHPCLELFDVHPLNTNNAINLVNEVTVSG
jgi:hypothetical protein